MDQEDAPAVVETPVSYNTPKRRLAVRRLWRAETIYALMLIAFAVLAIFAHLNAYFAWDLTAARTLQTFPLPGLFGLMRMVSFFGNGWHPYALTFVTFVVLLLWNRRSEAAGILFSAGGSALLNSLCKILIARPRPSSDLVPVFRQLKTQSFPSGHVTFYVCYFGFLFFVAYALLPRRSLARRLALTLTVIPVLLVGFSRVYLGAHWPSDTLGAYLISGLWLALSLDLYRRWKQRAAFHPQPEEKS